MSAKDVAVYLRHDERTIRRWAAAGSIPHVKMPGKRGAYIFSRTAIDEWLRGGGANDGK